MADYSVSSLYAKVCFTVVYGFFFMLCADSRMRHAVCNAAAGPEEQSGQGPTDLLPNSGHTALNTINHAGRKHTVC